MAWADRIEQDAEAWRNFASLMWWVTVLLLVVAAGATLWMVFPLESPDTRETPEPSHPYWVLLWVAATVAYVMAIDARRSYWQALDQEPAAGEVPGHVQGPDAADGVAGGAAPAHHEDS